MPHKTQLKVRTYECDEYGHVNNAVYLNYLEYARVEYLDAKSFPYRELRKMGIGVVVTAISIRYRKELLPGDEVVIETEPLKVGGVSGTFTQRILRGEDLCAEAEVSWVMTGPDGAPMRLTQEHKKLLTE